MVKYQENSPFCFQPYLIFHSRRVCPFLSFSPWSTCWWSRCWRPGGGLGSVDHGLDGDVQGLDDQEASSLFCLFSYLCLQARTLSFSSSLSLSYSLELFLPCKRNSFRQNGVLSFSTILPQFKLFWNEHFDHHFFISPSHSIMSAFINRYYWNCWQRILYYNHKTCRTNQYLEDQRHPLNIWNLKIDIHFRNAIKYLSNTITSVFAGGTSRGVSENWDFYLTFPFFVTFYKKKVKCYRIILCHFMFPGPFVTSCTKGFPV